MDCCSNSICQLVVTINDIEHILRPFFGNLSYQAAHWNGPKHMVSPFQSIQDDLKLVRKEVGTKTRIVPKAWQEALQFVFDTMRISALDACMPANHEDHDTCILSLQLRATSDKIAESKALMQTLGDMLHGFVSDLEMPMTQETGQAKRTSILDQLLGNPHLPLPPSVRLAASSATTAEDATESSSDDSGLIDNKETPTISVGQDRTEAPISPRDRVDLGPKLCEPAGGRQGSGASLPAYSASMRHVGPIWRKRWYVNNIRLPCGEHRYWVGPTEIALEQRGHEFLLIYTHFSLEDCARVFFVRADANPELESSIESHGTELIHFTAHAESGDRTQGSVLSLILSDYNVVLQILVAFGYIADKIHVYEMD